MKTGLIVRHVPYEGVAGYREPIEVAGYALDRIDVTDPAFVDVDLSAPDLLILMGGPMGVYETERYPWINHEIDKVAARVAADRPTLGVCLGAQMIAAAMGAQVYRGHDCEIGFGPLRLSGVRSPLRHLAGVPVLHWHGDTFDLPEGVELLASTTAYRHQGFRRGRNLLALQFHAEMGYDPRFEAWLNYLGCPDQRIRLERDYRRLGPGAVAAGQAMIGEWLRAIG